MNSKNLWSQRYVSQYWMMVGVKLFDVTCINNNLIPIFLNILRAKISIIVVEL